MRASTFLAASMLVAIAAGCAGSGSSSEAPGAVSVAMARLPALRVLPHRPHALDHLILTVRGADTTVTADSSWSLREAYEQWSASSTPPYRKNPAGIYSRRNYPSSFATLHSLELVLAPLAFEQSTPAGEEASREKGAGDGVGQRLRRYRKYVQVTVCLFRYDTEIERSSDLTLINDRGDRREAAEVAFVASGNTVQPYETDRMTPNDGSVPYRCYATYFERKKGDRDIMQGVRELRLVYARSAVSGVSVFRWKLPSGEHTASASG